MPNPGESCTATCDNGYELAGSAMRTCQDSGRWDGDNATCTRSE